MAHRTARHPYRCHTVAIEAALRAELHHRGVDARRLENLKTAGVQQPHKEDRITFTALTAWPGALVCAEGRYLEGATEKRAAIFIGPEFGTVQRADLVDAARVTRRPNCEAASTHHAPNPSGSVRAAPAG